MNSSPPPPQVRTGLLAAAGEEGRLRGVDGLLCANAMC